MSGEIKARLKEEAERLGFAAFAVGPAHLPAEKSAALDTFLAKGWQGDMTWIADRAAWRRDPQALWPAVKSAIVVADSYAPDDDPLANLENPRVGNLSVYARNRDYHDSLKPRLKTLARLAQQLTGADVKVFVDTAPVMEKPLAQIAGIGWQGKHTNLLSRDLGNWFFLGIILLATDLPADEPATENCGTCRRCLDVCPTKAFPAPFQLDARRCISYLTIEHKGPIDPELRPLIGNRIYGCDDCLAVCPWNKFAKAGQRLDYAAREELKAPTLAGLVELDDAAFRKLFAKSPVKRIGRDRFLRNVLIAIGNSGDESFLPALLRRLNDASPLVRGAAVWALGRLSAHDCASEAMHQLPLENDETVKAEWQAAIRGK